MSSRAGNDSSRLRRLRRLGHRLGLSILADRSGYMVTLETSRTVVLGDRPKPYSATLDEVEAYIDGVAAAG